MEQALLKHTRSRIANRIGLLVREQDDALLDKTVAERARALNLSGAAQYCQLLDSDADIRHEREALATAFTAGETYFFRDAGQHALLQDRILPELLERRKSRRALRIWCAACSSGEEAYSLSILLDELLADPSQWNIFILGTDINRQAIEKARRGIYTEWSFRSTSDERRQRYFRPLKNAWEVDSAIRARVTFRPGDLVDDEYPDHASGLFDMDLILCRNTFIYMAPQMVSRIADKLAATLADDGILITGHGELYVHQLGALRARVFPESIIYQKGASPYASPPPAAAQAPQRAPDKAAPPLPALRENNAAATPGKPAGTDTGKEPETADVQLAWQYANKGQRDRAAGICGEITAKDPLAAEPHYLLALLAQERGNVAEAAGLLKKVIYLDPSFVAAYLDLGDLYAHGGDAARARKMRATARGLLRAIPGDTRLRLYGESPASAILQYVEHLLDAGKE